MSYLHIPFSNLTTTERDFYNDARYGRADNIRARERNDALPDPDTRLTIHGETALHVSVHQDNPKTMAAILSAKANPDVQDSNQQTSLFLAAHAANTIMVNTLLAHNANPNIPDQTGNTPLHWAAYWGDIKMVNALVAAGAEINAVNDRGETPLMWSTANPNKDVSRHLIAHGADKTITDNNGHTVTNHAEKRLQPELANWLTTINPNNVLPVVIPFENDNSPLPLTRSVQAFREARQTMPKVPALTRHR